MSRARRTRATKRHLQPYAWLGAGAVTVGMGVAIVGAPAVAFATTGNDGADNSSTSASADPGSTSTTSSTPHNRGSRAGVGNASSDSSPTRRGTTSAPVVTPVATPDVTADIAADLPEVTPEPAKVDSPLPAAVVATAPAPAHRSNTPAPVISPAADTVADADPAPAASVLPAAVVDPAPNMDKSWLPTAQIVPGAKFKQALAEIEQAQALLSDETWGKNNILAGIGSLGPQAALATAQLMLSIWASTIANAQAFVKNTADNPLIHWIAQANLQSELLWPKLSDFSLLTANALMTPLSWVGADVTGAQAVTAAARQDGKIYAQVPIRIKAGTEPVIDAKLNGGSKATLLVDTGASGIVTTRDKIGNATLGTMTGSGNSCFSGNLCYHYETYNMEVDLGDGAVATTPVNIVTDIPNDPVYKDSVANFKEFFSWGADGIIGVGANTEGPGPKPIPTAAMPGSLSEGLLIYQNAYPFGLGGYMILGPNLFPTRVSVPGAPDAYTKVRINGQPAQRTESGAIIDSGGVYGTIRKEDVPAGVTLEKINGYDYLPAGTKIDVYTRDGSTLLYSYTTIQGGTPVINGGLYNTGNAPYAQQPIYLNYTYDGPYGIGSTDFSIA